MKDLIVLEQINAVEIFIDGGLDDMLERIQKIARSVLTNAETPEGVAEIKALAMQVSRSKTALESAGKALVADQKKSIKIIDNARKKSRETLDALRDEIRAPVTAIEDAEKAADQAIDDALAMLWSYGKESNALGVPYTIDSLNRRAVELEALKPTAIRFPKRFELALNAWEHGAERIELLIHKRQKAIAAELAAAEVAKPHWKEEPLTPPSWPEKNSFTIDIDRPHNAPKMRAIAEQVAMYCESWEQAEKLAEAIVCGYIRGVRAE